MEFVRVFNTSGIVMIIFMGVIVGGVVVGKKLRDRKDAKDSSQQ